MMGINAIIIFEVDKNINLCLQAASVNYKSTLELKEVSMSFLEIVKKRSSVRSYTEQRVEKEKLDQILEAAQAAPTAANLAEPEFRWKNWFLMKNFKILPEKPVDTIF